MAIMSYSGFARARRLAGLLYAMGLVLTAAAFSVLASHPAHAADSSLERRLERYTLIGNWLVEIPRPGQLNLISLQTYFADGNMLEESNSSAIRSLAHGEWDITGRREFRRTWTILRFDAARNFVGYHRNSATITMSPDGRTFEARSTVQLIDATTGTITSTTHATETGRRL